MQVQVDELRHGLLHFTGTGGVLAAADLWKKSSYAQRVEEWFQLAAEDYASLGDAIFIF
jgi:hypothetical protein